MIKKLHITLQDYDRLSPEAKKRYKEFYINIRDDISSAHLIDGVPAMTIGDAMDFLCRYSASKWIIEFSKDIVAEPLDLLFHAVAKILENNKKL